jgi:predicted GIY-YIG superfamily endonuclease
MPKADTDYSNTIIYKITCKDDSINEVYIGHTTNFLQRQYDHKQCCKNNQCKLYTTIRNNGGWDNWTMEIINCFNCKDHYEARQKEQEYYELLHATLNSIQPMPNHADSPIFCCESCNYTCFRKFNWEQHLLTLKHTKNNNLMPTLNTIHECKKCDIKFKHTSSYYRHKKKCLIDNVNIDNNIVYDKELVLMLIKQNTELLEIIKNGMNNTTV